MSLMYRKKTNSRHEASSRHEALLRDATPSFGTISIPKLDSSAQPIITLEPATIRNAIANGSNIEIQTMIDTLLKADSHFLGKYQDRLSVIRKAQFNWKPSSDEQKDIDFCEEMKAVIQPKLTKGILKHLLNAIFRRFSLVEIQWKMNGTNYDFDLQTITPRAFEFSPFIDGKEEEPTTLYLWDSENEKATPIPDNKAIKVYSDIQFNEIPVSISEVIAILVVIKYYAMQKDWTRFNELFGLPMRLGSLDPNANQDDYEKLKKALIELGSDSAGVISGLSKIDFLQPKNNSPEMFEKIIKLCNEEISKAIIGQAGTSENGKESSYASMKILNGVREDIVQDSLDLLTNAINEQLIKPFCLYNYGMTENIPTLSLELPVNYDAFIERDKGLKDLGIQFKKEYFQKRYDLDEADFDVSEQNSENAVLSNESPTRNLSPSKQGFTARVNQEEGTTTTRPEAPLRDEFRSCHPESIEGRNSTNTINEDLLEQFQALKKKVENPFF